MDWHDASLPAFSCVCSLVWPKRLGGGEVWAHISGFSHVDVDVDVGGGAVFGGEALCHFALFVVSI